MYLSCYWRVTTAGLVLINHASGYGSFLEVLGDLNSCSFPVFPISTLESICRSVRLSTKFDSPDWQTSYMNHMSCFILFLQGVYLNSSSYSSSFIQFWILAAFLNEWSGFVASSLFLQGRFLKPVPGTRICIYLGWNSGGFCLLSLSRSLWMVSLPSIISAAPPVYGIFSFSLWEYVLFCSPHHYEDAEQHRSQYCLLRCASHNLAPCTLQTTVHYSLSWTVHQFLTDLSYWAASTP